MSQAGIQSNRGDLYQTLVAMDWALIVLVNPDYQWIEIDSVRFEVDDVVIGKSDGTVICCQCKKNEPSFKYWSVSELKDELNKAARLLESNPNASVRFYSRSPFGELKNLQEYCTTQPNETSYKECLGKEQRKIDENLGATFSPSTQQLSTYDFLFRTMFENTQEIDTMRIHQIERLQFIASNPQAAYNALWTRLDQLGARTDNSSTSISAQHRLTKEELNIVIEQAGAILTPQMDIAKLHTLFKRTSVIGRTWQREIAGHRFANPALNEILTAIDAKKKSILLTGPPGSGKTCVMLELQEELEQRARTSGDLLPLFLQSREFANLTTVQEREAQGLPGTWVEQTSRLAEKLHVVVVIDSLDVLSIAREHSILTYFLAQIDRLLQIPNVTVVTACRDFDRHYDKRIADRQWDCELMCSPLNWNSEIKPLLEKLKIDTTAIDVKTRELIQNPRELALFVELAQRNSTFNVANSQVLAQQYIDTFVHADDALGDSAVQAIEKLASEMLMNRKLSVPNQRFTGSQKILRHLYSLNVLRKTQTGELTFGHQTLLDVLVISSALRQGYTLNEFIAMLPPVPFVRPSIRSFIAQLAAGDRREFKKQILAVLTGNAAFHIRRLAAESFTEQKPLDDNWSMISKLYHHHRDVFQVIYTQARRIEWFFFWHSHLVPMLKDTKDINGLTAHVYQVSLWINDAPREIVAFWTEILQIDWLEITQIVGQLEFYLSKIKTDNLTFIVPLAKLLISMPRPDHSFLGRLIAQCVSAGALDDFWLWNYIADDINENKIIEHRIENKLHCQPHEFGDMDDQFLQKRMAKSTKLLDLALHSIEEWREIKLHKYGLDSPQKYYSVFLTETSYREIHTQHDINHVDSLNILMDAIETAIIKHATTNSTWWKLNRERLCFSYEGALRYFAIRAFIQKPESNIDIVGRLLEDMDVLSSDLFYELGTLINKAFIYLPVKIQQEVMNSILSFRENDLTDETNSGWVLRQRVELLKMVPSHLRSNKVQAIIDHFENVNGALIREPRLLSCGGMVHPPFSYKVFHNLNDDSVIRLLKHYSGYKRDFEAFLTGGEEEVGRQLSEAASLHPIRFLHLLSTSWSDISEKFRDDIMDGVAKYLLHRFGNLKPNGKWEPIEEADGPTLARHIIDHLERHSKHWKHNRSASAAIQSCAHVITNTQDADRLVFLAIGFETLQEESTITGETVDPITAGINMILGNIIEALMILANRLLEQNIPFPELLSPALQRFAQKEKPAIRALMLRRLPYFQSIKPELGWKIFYIIIEEATGLWQHAERCLYYAYYNQYEKVAPLLQRIYYEGNDKDMETWGRISALSALATHLDMSEFLHQIKTADKKEAWIGAASVFTHPENIKQHRETCIEGIKYGLHQKPTSSVIVAQKMMNLFQENIVVSIPTELIKLFFSVLENSDEDKQTLFLRFDGWLNSISNHDPEKSLDIAEIYLSYVEHTKSNLYDYDNNLTKLMTRLFAEAEEREEADNELFLRRTVSIQDKLLALGVNSINEWIKAAERP